VAYPAGANVTLVPFPTTNKIKIRDAITGLPIKHPVQPNLRPRIIFGIPKIDYLSLHIWM
jgi:hypothetical protein